MSISIVSQLRAAINPARFAALAGITPDPWQAKLLCSRAPRILVNCSRQSGKSFTAATLALHEAIYHAGSLVLMVSPSQRQSGELFRKALALYRQLGRPVPPESETALTLELENGSRIVALPGKEGTIRGYSGASLLVVDESAHVLEETYMSVLPMLAVSRGRLVALSTPRGTRGWWYEAYRTWRDDHTTWDYYEVRAEDCPRIPKDFLEQQEREIGAWWFQQEYGCVFLDAQTAAFRSEDIERALSDDYEPWDFL